MVIQKLQIGKEKRDSKHGSRTVFKKVSGYRPVITSLPAKIRLHDSGNTVLILLYFMNHMEILYIEHPINFHMINEFHAPITDKSGTVTNSQIIVGLK